MADLLQYRSSQGVTPETPNVLQEGSPSAPIYSALAQTADRATNLLQAERQRDVEIWLRGASAQALTQQQSIMQDVLSNLNPNEPDYEKAFSEQFKENWNEFYSGLDSRVKQRVGPHLDAQLVEQTAKNRLYVRERNIQYSKDETVKYVNMLENKYLLAGREGNDETVAIERGKITAQIKAAYQELSLYLPQSQIDEITRQEMVRIGENAFQADLQVDPARTQRFLQTNMYTQGEEEIRASLGENAKDYIYRENTRREVEIGKESYKQRSEIILDYLKNGDGASAIKRSLSLQKDDQIAVRGYVEAKLKADAVEADNNTFWRMANDIDKGDMTPEQAYRLIPGFGDEMQVRLRGMVKSREEDITTNKVNLIIENVSEGLDLTDEDINFMSSLRPDQRVLIRNNIETAQRKIQAKMQEEEDIQENEKMEGIFKDLKELFQHPDKAKELSQSIQEKINSIESQRNQLALTETLSGKVASITEDKIREQLGPIFEKLTMGTPLNPDDISLVSSLDPYQRIVILEGLEKAKRKVRSENLAQLDQQEQEKVDSALSKMAALLEPNANIESLFLEIKEITNTILDPRTRLQLQRELRAETGTPETREEEASHQFAEELLNGMNRWAIDPNDPQGRSPTATLPLIEKLVVGDQNRVFNAAGRMLQEQQVAQVEIQNYEEILASPYSDPYNPDTQKAVDWFYNQRQIKTMAELKAAPEEERPYIQQSFAEETASLIKNRGKLPSVYRSYINGYFSKTQNAEELRGTIEEFTSYYNTAPRAFDNENSPPFLFFKAMAESVSAGVPIADVVNSALVKRDNLLNPAMRKSNKDWFNDPDNHALFTDQLDSMELTPEVKGKTMRILGDLFEWGVYNVGDVDKSVELALKSVMDSPLGIGINYDSQGNEYQMYNAPGNVLNINPNTFAMFFDDILKNNNLIPRDEKDQAWHDRFAAGVQRFARSIVRPFVSEGVVPSESFIPTYRLVETQMTPTNHTWNIYQIGPDGLPRPVPDPDSESGEQLEYVFDEKEYQQYLNTHKDEIEKNFKKNLSLWDMTSSSGYDILKKLNQIEIGK